MERESILIVEDEKLVALDLLRKLERFGYEVSGSAIDAPSAMEMAAQQRPGLAIVDAALAGPEGAGIELAATLRRTYGCAIVFVSAYADKRTLERARVAEPLGWVMKPLRERELFSTVDMAFYKNAMESRLRRQERLFSAILHSINDAIVATDNDLNVQFMNPVAEALTGWSEADARGRPAASVAEVVDPGSGRRYLDEPAVADEAPLFFRQAVLADRSGREIAVDGSLSRIRESGNYVEGFILALRDVTQVRELERRVDYQASHDVLTGLYNREELVLRLQAALAAPRPDGTTDALLLMDVDRFRPINDTCGTIAGDELLRHVADCLRSLISREDLAARVGPDEFALILKGCGARDAERVAQRIQAALAERRFVWDGDAYPVSLSIGVVPLEPGSGGARAALEAADDAVSMAKEGGGARIDVFAMGDSRYQRRHGQKEWIQRINRALEEDGFILYVQPIMPLDPARGLPPMAEILLRMRTEDGGVAAPDQFIPAAERYNLMGGVDRWVLSRAMRALGPLIGRGGSDPLTIYSINISGQSLLDPGLDAFIGAACREAGIDPSRICLEVTETAAIQNLSHASRLMKSLKELGFSFALDDFGSGFSSFGYLQSLPVDHIKIDGSFVRGMETDRVSRTMVESIHSMGKIMGLASIAEYAATPGCLAALRSLGVDYAQGNAVSPPRPLQV